jgi:hypothetical protein
MEADRAREVAERDQMWASLRALRPAIDRLAAGRSESAEEAAQVAVLLARIVAAELDFQARESDPQTDP